MTIEEIGSCVKLMPPADAFTAVGLLLDIIGFLTLFFAAPEKLSDPQATVSFALEDNYREIWRKKLRQRTWVARIGAALIAFGFFLQLIAVVF